MILPQILRTPILPPLELKPAQTCPRMHRIILSVNHCMEQKHNYGLEIRAEGTLDLLSLGALVHRLDPGLIPFR